MKDRLAGLVPRWTVLRAVSRNPLVRRADRIEAAVLAVLIALVVLIGVPFAAASGQAVYESLTHRSAAELQQAKRVAAVVVAPTPTKGPLPPGTRLEFVVDRDGHLLDSAPDVRAAIGSGAVGFTVWLGLAAAAWAVLRVIRMALDRARSAAWAGELDRLLHE